MIKSVIWTSMVDYPSRTCTVLFTGNCNFDCEYCYNRGLIKKSDLNFEKDIFPKLLDRFSLIDSVLISGGECTLEQDFEKIVKLLKENGFNVGIHTNGLEYEKIKKNIDNIDFFGIDYKASDEKYNLITKSQVDINIIKETINLVVENNKEYEIRTTIYPKYIDIDDCTKIAHTLKELGVKKYYIQQYKRVDNLNNKPYDVEYIEKIKNECDKIIPTYIKN